MPGMDGLATLREIRELNRSKPKCPPIEVLLVSSLTTQGARCTVEGLQLGAIDFVLKPSGGTELQNIASLEKSLKEKLQLYKQKLFGRQDALSKKVTSPAIKTEVTSNLTDDSLRSKKPGTYQAIAIGISTGGPETLTQLLPDLAGKTSVPIFIVQHILSGLSSYFAESLSRRLNHPILEAKEDMLVMPGGIYLAQSGSHMILRRKEGRITIGLSDSPPENHSRPSVDVFLRSAAATYGSSLIAAIMTGMLNDGANGIRAVKRAGGFVIAQDQATSIIWGMPRAAIETGVVDVVLPLDQFASTFLKLVGSTKQA